MNCSRFMVWGLLLLLAWRPGIAFERSSTDGWEVAGSAHVSVLHGYLHSVYWPIESQMNSSPTGVGAHCPETMTEKAV